MPRLSRPKQRSPYGTYDVGQETIEQYTALAPSLSDDYPLPEQLPLHHPLLQQLEGTYPVQDAPAPWWPLCVAQGDPLLRPLLAALSVEEYRLGTIADERWRAFKQEHENAWPARLPKSTPWLEATAWSPWFTNRVPAETLHALDLVVSTHPAHFINMSNGAGWRNCQHYRKGGENGCLPGNFYDTAVTVALLATVYGAPFWLSYEWFPPYLDGELEIDERLAPWYSIKGIIRPYRPGL